VLGAEDGDTVLNCFDTFNDGSFLLGGYTSSEKLTYGKTLNAKHAIYVKIGTNGNFDWAKQLETTPAAISIKSCAIDSISNKGVLITESGPRFLIINHNDGSLIDKQII
jgi:hypothetical protein